MERPQVWLIGGTSESVDCAHALRAQSIPYVVTVTTAAAQNLYPPDAQVRVGKMTPALMDAFVRQWRIGCILDASHPFACDISQQAIALSTRSPHMLYLRYERPAIAPSSTADTPHIVWVNSIEALLNRPLLWHHRVLLTLGYRHLKRFSSLRVQSRLFARVLPSREAISHALAAGFTSKDIIALRPPVSFALEKALCQQWNITTVVAKASGQPGGEIIKRQIAAELGIRLVLIQRPAIAYPQQTNEVKTAIQFCAQALRSDT